MRANALSSALTVLAAALAATGCGGDAPDATPNTPDQTEARERAQEAADEASTDESDSSSVSVSADLQVRVWARAGGDEVAEGRVTCPAEHGAGQAMRDACALLERDPNVLDPLPDAAVRGACEPTSDSEVADVQGTINDATIDARLTRADACEAERWDAAAAIFAAVGYPGS